MSQLTFLRHAETDLAGTFCGHSDPPLNTRGQAQLNDLIARLMPGEFDEVYSSDLRRAVDTARTLAKSLSISCLTRPNLREIHFGEWEGMTWSQIERRDPEYARRWTDLFPVLPAPAGELFADFERRVLSEVNQLLYLSTEKKIVVVTHAGVMRVVLKSFLACAQQQAWERTKSYCCSFVLDTSGLAQKVCP